MSKRYTNLERTAAVFRCQSGEDRQTVADELGVKYQTLWQWEQRGKPIKAEVLLEMLKQHSADCLARGEDLPEGFEAMVSVVKLALQKELA